VPRCRHDRAPRSGRRDGERSRRREGAHAGEPDEQSAAWFREKAAGKAKAGPSPLGFQFFLGTDYPQMARNQVRDLAEKRIRTVAYICRA
jgi:hypothetical protein